MFEYDIEQDLHKFDIEQDLQKFDIAQDSYYSLLKVILKNYSITEKNFQEKIED